MDNVVETKTLYLVINNTDPVEGRGTNYPYAVCETLETAERLAKGKFTQGYDCPIQPITAYLSKNQPYWYGPTYIHAENDEDRKLRIQRENEKQKSLAVDAVIEKMKKLGISDEEIKLITATM